MLILLLACAGEGQTLTLGGRQATLRVEVVNPSNCSYCDAFLLLDTLRVDVWMGDEVVATGSFAWPAEAPELPALAEFGVVRVELLGFSAGRVVSAGRTAEVAFDPEGETTVPLVFLPANTAIPLVAELVTDRSRHVAWRRPDGTVALVGGVDPDRESTFASVEHFDPVAFTFTDGGMALPASVAAPRVGVTGDGDRLLAGGFQAAPWGEEPTERASTWVRDEDTLEAVGDLHTPRNGHCFAMYRDRLGIVFGGDEAGDAGELVKLDKESGTWAWSNIPMRDFDAGAVTGCAGLVDERVFVLGEDAGATGVWDYREGVEDPGEAFTALPTGSADRYVRGAWLHRRDDGVVWIAGGVDVTTGTVVEEGRRFDPGSNRLEVGARLAEGRFDPAGDRWIRGDHVVVGGGWADEERREPVQSLEWVDPVTGAAGPLVPLDRARDGASFTTLLDGSVLVAGGYDAGDAGVIDAALVVPWFEGE